MAEERRYLDDLVIRGAHVFGKDFAGMKYEQGKRSFCLRIDDEELAKKMAQDGWNVKQFEPENPNDPITYFINVKVSYKIKAPIVKMISNGKITDLDENTVGTLDRVRFANVDVAVHPNWYSFGRGAAHKEGFTAYLNEIWVTIRNESRFADEYAERYTATNEDEEVPFN